ncbi:MAG: hypothetical protein IJ381_08440 [Clostridia bacterium]|nr:hypothetical protein [Clostridia bacterium]MBQ7982627.1 hypothetical protein [Clostridia bacterium]
MKKDEKKLQMWRDRLSAGEAAYANAHDDFAEMDRLYTGDYKTITPMMEGDTVTETPVLRNIVREIIEAQINTAIPMPKVTAKRKEDEPLAELIEDMLRDEIDRMDMEVLNDTLERMTPVYGGAVWVCEWDNARNTHKTSGDIAVSILHPKSIVPQDGVSSGIQDMDWCIAKIPMTKTQVFRRYNVRVDEEIEEEPGIRDGQDNASESTDMVTVYFGYYRNDNGGIGLYAWCGDSQLADFDDYQVRRMRRCKKCGAPEDESTPIGEQTQDGMYPEIDTSKPRRRQKNICSYCGASAWEESEEDYMELSDPPLRSDGTPVFEPVQTLADTGALDALGNPIRTVVMQKQYIPYYKPDMYPLHVQRNTSRYGRLIGESDVNQIKTQQNAINRLEAKIMQKAIRFGAIVTTPPLNAIDMTAADVQTIPLDNIADAQYFQKFDFALSVEQELALEEQHYQHARQIIGITDSYQGRTDRTATSGKAKEFSAAQAAGRMESKRKNKEAAMAAMYETMFKFVLAYADEPRSVRHRDDRGQTVYREFTKWDFLLRDEAGEWYWNDDFLFSCDTASPLANNREAMWQETRANLQAGAFGDPNSPDTLVMFWEKMELLHYPGAGETLRYLKDMMQRQAEAQQAQQAQQMQAQQEQMAAEAAAADADRQAAEQSELRAAEAQRVREDEEMQMRIIEQARADAKEMAQARMGQSQTALGA